MSDRQSPIIGITTYSRSESGEFALPGAYVDAVQAAGGIPILFPPNQPAPTRLLDIIDGLIFSGGGDIAPEAYGGNHHPTIYMVDAERDEFELTLAKRAIACQIPVLGICRGMQILTVASGGSLITHVPEVYGDQIHHRLDHPRRPIEHPVQIDPQSRLGHWLGTELTVVSWHHQAVQAVPAGWRQVAQAADGLVEAIEHLHHPWLIAVQWHPELSSVESAHPRLFEALVKAASKI